MINLGEVYHTRSGLPATILSTTVKDPKYPVCGLIDHGDVEVVCSWTQDGKSVEGIDLHFPTDLVTGGACRHPFEAGLLKLNAMHMNDNSGNPDLEAIYHFAKDLEKIKPPGVCFQTDVEEDSSQWNEWCDTAEEYVTIVAGFQLATDERGIDWEFSDTFDDALSRFDKAMRRVLDLGIPKQVIINNIVAIADLDYEMDNELVTTLVTHVNNM